jgi:hypothetical protein
VAFSPCSHRALGLHGFEWEEESLMDVHFEQAFDMFQVGVPLASVLRDETIDDERVLTIISLRG